MNQMISVTPFPQKVPGIIDGDPKIAQYFFKMGQSTKLIVTAANAEYLERMATRTVKNARDGKIESRARFSFTRLDETDKPVTEGLKNCRGVCEVPAFEVPAETANKLLHENLKATQAVLAALPDVLKGISQQKR
jgi:hypothetical protein